MKKICLIISIITVIMLFGCNDNNSVPADSTQTEAPTEITTEFPAETAPSSEEFTEKQTEVPEKCFHVITEKIPEFVPETDVFYDVWKDFQYYVVPNVETEIELPGSVSIWCMEQNDILDWEVRDGKLCVTAKKTGYVNLKSESGERATIFSNNVPEKNERRKAEDLFEYYLYYEKDTHTLTIYKEDSDGYYTVPFRTICTASGATRDKTPTGLFTLGEKERWHTFSANCHAQYGIKYASGVFLHSPCYSEKRESSILSHYYNTIGESSTGGCLRMQTGYINWIFENCESGTKLEITNGNPLGTDSGVPADIAEAACFDPTDPVIKGRVNG